MNTSWYNMTIRDMFKDITFTIIHYSLYAYTFIYIKYYQISTFTNYLIKYIFPKSLTSSNNNSLILTHKYYGPLTTNNKSNQDVVEKSYLLIQNTENKNCRVITLDNNYFNQSNVYFSVLLINVAKQTELKFNATNIDDIDTDLYETYDLILKDKNQNYFVIGNKFDTEFFEYYLKYVLGYTHIDLTTYDYFVNIIDNKNVYSLMLKKNTLVIKNDTYEIF